MKMDEIAEWEREILDDLFDPGDRDRILKTPISPDLEDDWYWRFDAKGKYSVKNAYRNLTMQSNVYANSDDHHWPSLWKLKIPGKVKILWWRIIKEIIPVRDVLRRRGVDLDTAFPLCANHPETIKHLFLDCSKTQEVWSLCNLDIVRTNPDNFILKCIPSNLDNATLLKIASVLWVVWRARNNVIWRGLNWNASSVSRHASNIMQEWLIGVTTTNEERTVVEDDVSRWNPPESGWLKCNVDVALFKEDKKVGFGLILRDNRTNFVAAKGGLLNCFFDPGIAEAYACREAIKWILTKDFSNVIIESDCLEVVKAIH